MIVSFNTEHAFYLKKSNRFMYYVDKKIYLSKFNACTVHATAVFYDFIVLHIHKVQSSSQQKHITDEVYAVVLVFLLLLSCQQERGEK